MLAGSGFESLSSKLVLSKNGSQIGWSSHMCTYIYLYIYICIQYIPYQNGINGHILGVNSAVFIGPRLLQVKPLGIIGLCAAATAKNVQRWPEKRPSCNWSHRSWKSSETPKRSVKQIQTGHNMTGKWTSRTYFDYTLWGFWLTLYYCVRITKSFTFFWPGCLEELNLPYHTDKKKHGFSAFAS